jgi:hypothetical protein
MGEMRRAIAREEHQGQIRYRFASTVAVPSTVRPNEITRAVRYRFDGDATLVTAPARTPKPQRINTLRLIKERLYATDPYGVAKDAVCSNSKCFGTPIHSSAYAADVGRVCRARVPLPKYNQISRFSRLSSNADTLMMTHSPNFAWTWTAMLGKGARAYK